MRYFACTRTYSKWNSEKAGWFVYASRFREDTLKKSDAKSLFLEFIIYFCILLFSTNIHTDTNDETVIYGMYGIK